MPEKRTMERAKRAKKEGKAPTTQAGAFVREEMEHTKGGKHDVKSRKQAIAIGLSKARRSGVELPPKTGRVQAKSSSRTASAYRAGQKKKSSSRKGARTKSSR